MDEICWVQFPVSIEEEVVEVLVKVKEEVVEEVKVNGGKNERAAVFLAFLRAFTETKGQIFLSSSPLELWAEENNARVEGGDQQMLPHILCRGKLKVSYNFKDGIWLQLISTDDEQKSIRYHVSR